ncbi:MAG TPA: hypothetical protein VGM41_08795, partial [Chitinophagaceae bacterium]
MDSVLKHISALGALLVTVVFAFAQSPSFVEVKGTQFMIDGRPYYFVGANMWYAGLLATGPNAEAGKKRLERELDFLKKEGITNIRVMLGAEGQARAINGVRPVHPALQPEEGRYDEQLFDGLDYLLAQLGRRKMYAVFFISNNWEWSGGFLQYLTWKGKIDTAAVAKKFSWDEYRDYVSRFYRCAECIDAYHNYVRAV